MQAAKEYFLPRLAIFCVYCMIMVMPSEVLMDTVIFTAGGGVKLMPTPSADYSLPETTA